MAGALEETEHLDGTVQVVVNTGIKSTLAQPLETPNLFESNNIGNNWNQSNTMQRPGVLCSYTLARLSNLMFNENKAILCLSMGKIQKALRQACESFKILDNQWTQFKGLIHRVMGKPFLPTRPLAQKEETVTEEPASDPEPQHNKRKSRSTKNWTGISAERARVTDATARRSNENENHCHKHNIKLPLNVCKTVFVALVLLLRMSSVQACSPMQSPQSATVGRSHTCFQISQHKDYNVNDGNVTIGGCSTLVGPGSGMVEPDHTNNYVVSFNGSHCCVTLNNWPCGRDKNISFTSTGGTDCIYDILKGLPCSPNWIDNNSCSRYVIIVITLAVILIIIIGIIIVLLIRFRKRVGKWIRWRFGTNRGTYDMTDQNETS
ncbi:uncharacterized protein LOC127871651 [Dreissena polymorpha]|uniref:Uncharacterized protein n=1 Tax=Dreissena polymorpha TaxID=45954 RepID=A0A9D4LKR7_DREPO|nr:uncharacterized protein LOC127871651 [Dreissena polymorpha]XP_052270731.1 uncharacterized protein LOC127871651 [Dreissena polymorpha]XP_052270732.1 uncharacterized protein LOC127871651 [Dreissena polymorpha]KAH3858626.1 hypothetical protein DPMN_101254 [Dreissena polymorpha]